jgi:hypothetical protein
MTGSLLEIHDSQSEDYVVPRYPNKRSVTGIGDTSQKIFWYRGTERVRIQSQILPIADLTSGKHSAGSFSAESAANILAGPISSLVSVHVIQSDDGRLLRRIGKQLLC